MSTAENKALAHRFVAAFNGGAWDDLDAIVDAGVVTHGAAPVAGLAALKQVFAGFRAAFPDITETIEDILAEGDRVVSRITVRGTHRGDLMGIPATGRSVAVTGIVLDRIAGGKIAEEWNQSDMLGLLRQLGAIPTP
jgi:steroid delta-isomerase-like uncharacterized protein